MTNITMNHILQRLGLYGRTCRHIRLQQAVSFVEYRCRRLYYQSPFYPSLEEKVPVPTKLKVVPLDLWRGDKTQGKQIADNTFVFFADKYQLDERANWYPKNKHAEWQKCLHDFDWIAHLKAMGDEGIPHANRLLESWLENCSQYHLVSWHPAVLSKRIVNWLVYADWLFAKGGGTLHEFFMYSLTQQAALMERCLQWDVGGFYLLKNLKALIYIGLCLPGKQTTYLDGLNILLDQLKIQINPDGSHYQRSALYHAELLRDFLDIQALIRRAGHTVPPQLSDVIDRMTTALHFYIYPDEKLGLFHDGTTLNADQLGQLVARCGVAEETPALLHDAGFARLERGKTMIMADVGAPCPKGVDYFAHACTLAFELCVGEERVFVNSGTYGPHPVIRQQLRETGAHNTVEIGKHSSAEVWGYARVGRRPRIVRATVREEADVGVGLDAAHDGYRHLGIIHNRRIFLNEAGDDIRGEDYLTTRTPTDSTVVAWFHLHPNMHYKIKNEFEAEITTPQKKQLRLKVSGGSLRDSESKYAPLYGEVTPAKAITVHGRWDTNKCIIRWAIKLI